MKTTWIILVVLVLAIAGGYIWWSGQDQTPMEQATGAASDAGAAASDAADSATDAATGAASDAAGAASDMASSAMSVGDYLTPDSFDATKLAEIVQGSSLSDEVKTTLVTAIEKAGSNPALVQSVIDQVKSAFGM